MRRKTKEEATKGLILRDRQPGTEEMAQSLKARFTTKRQETGHLTEIQRNKRLEVTMQTKPCPENMF